MKMGAVRWSSAARSRDVWTPPTLSRGTRQPVLARKRSNGEATNPPSASRSNSRAHVGADELRDHVDDLIVVRPRDVQAELRRKAERVGNRGVRSLENDRVRAAEFLREVAAAVVLADHPRNVPDRLRRLLRQPAVVPSGHRPPHERRQARKLAVEVEDDAAGAVERGVDERGGVPRRLGPAVSPRGDRAATCEVGVGALPGRVHDPTCSSTRWHARQLIDSPPNGRQRPSVVVSVVSTTDPRPGGGAR
jgi:hypothetical protein